MIHRDEATKASSLSPGVVLNDEELLREVYEHHLDGDRIRYSAVTVKELRQNGFSLHRRSHVNQGSVEAAVAERESKSRNVDVKWRLMGLSVLTAYDIRSITDQNDAQGFVVVDTAKAQNNGHASVYVKSEDTKPSQIRKMRESLVKLLEQRICSVDHIFSSCV